MYVEYSRSEVIRERLSFEFMLKCYTVNWKIKAEIYGPF